MIKLLLLHGALASKSQYDNLLPCLDKNIAATAINFSGHGGTLMPIGGYTFETFSNDILKEMNTHGLNKVNLFGYSMGGYAALYFAKMHPDKVHKIFTLNTKFNWDPTSTARETAKLNAEKLMDKVPAFANNLMLQHGMQIWKNVLLETENLMTNLTKHVGLTPDDYKAIENETIIGCSDKDLTATFDENREVYKLLPHAHFLCLPNSTHPFEQINPLVLAPVINQFFNS